MPNSSDDQARLSPIGVVAALESVIFDELEIGASLPAEAELATRFGVSRLTLREGIRKLEARGLLDVSQGRRAVVAAPTGVHMGDGFVSAIRRSQGAVLELLEVRRALEVHSVSIAAKRADEVDLDGMARAVAAMRAANDPARYLDADLGFHQLLARSAHNSMLTLVIDGLTDALRLSLAQSYRGHLNRGLRTSDAVEQHAEILELVRSRDAGGAARAMRLHLRQAERDLQAAQRSAQQPWPESYPPEWAASAAERAL